MVLELFVNFCTLFTFAMLMFWFAKQQKQSQFPLLRKFPGYTIGLLSGIFGVVLMLTSIHIGESIIIDGRMAVLALSGLFGGPMAPVIAGILMGTARILLNEISTNSIIAGVNTMVIGIVIGLVAWRIPITFQNAWKYFAYTTMQTVLVIGYLSFSSGFIAGRGALFILYSLISFGIVYLTLLKMDQLSKEIERIEQYSVTDYLTGIPNNRKFQELFQEWQQTHTSFYLAVADIDYFKKVNDQYGHPVGDLVLKEIAHRLSKEMEKIDGLVARIGGEEFAMIVPAETDVEASDKLENVRHSVSSLPFELTKDVTLSITISVGAAGYPKHKQTSTELYKAADDELYRAKQQGRNCVRVLNGKRGVSSD